MRKLINSGWGKIRSYEEYYTKKSTYINDIMYLYYECYSAR